MTESRTAPPRFGVEEEFLLLDAVTGVPRGEADALIEALPDARAEHEYFTCQIETATPICVNAEQAIESLTEFRIAAAGAATARGLVLAGTGLPPLGGDEPGVVSSRKRYREIAASMHGLLDTYYSTGTHVHVEVPSRDVAVRVISRIARWSPLLVALTANSPLHLGRESGYACRRHLLTQQWPTSGYTPDFADAAAYERVVAGLVRSGSLLDTALVNWSIRLSERFPTIEVRVADSQLEARDAVAFALLFRAMVARALREQAAELPFEPCQPDLLRGAHWRAARDGLTGELVDPIAGVLRPAGELITALMDHLAADLEAAGDRGRIEAFLARRLADGGPAQVQLAAWRSGGIEALLALYGTGSLASSAQP